MKKGDLVKVSNKGFTAIGYIKDIMNTHGYLVVHYFTTDGTPNFRGESKGGLWSKKYVTLLKEVEDEKDTGKT